MDKLTARLQAIKMDLENLADYYTNKGETSKAYYLTLMIGNCRGLLEQIEYDQKTTHTNKI